MRARRVPTPAGWHLTQPPIRVFDADAENSGYWERSTSFLDDESMTTGEITFYDSNTGEPLFYAPRGRSWESFVRESKAHGWPSFRDEETNWEHVRILPNGEAISTAGTHLGHNLPDGRGNRYCIVRRSRTRI